MRTKPLLALLAAGAGVLSMFTAPTATAAGESALACRSFPYSWDAGYADPLPNDPTTIPGNDEVAHDGYYGDRKIYRASTRCQDVNLKINYFGDSRFVEARVCYPAYGWCEQAYYINSGDYEWKEIKKGIPDGTLFYVKFDYNNYIYGVIAH